MGTRKPHLLDCYPGDFTPTFWTGVFPRDICRGSQRAWKVRFGTDGDTDDMAPGRNLVRHLVVSDDRFVAKFDTAVAPKSCPALGQRNFEIFRDWFDPGAARYFDDDDERLTTVQASPDSPCRRGVDRGSDDSQARIVVANCPRFILFAVVSQGVVCRSGLWTKPLVRKQLKLRLLGRSGESEVNEHASVRVEGELRRKMPYITIEFSVVCHALALAMVCGRAAG